MCEKNLSKDFIKLQKNISEIVNIYILDIFFFFLYLKSANSLQA